MGTRVPAAMAQLKEPVHENLTELSIRCARAPLARGPLKAGSFDNQDMILRCAGRSGELHSRASDLGEDAEDLIRAVRFNDAPPVKTASGLAKLVTPSALMCGEVRVPENAACWALLMAHAGGLSANDPGNREFAQGGNFLFRSHFGDMQYLHAMASRGETLAQGLARILLWSKFAYQVASGEIAETARIGSRSEFATLLKGFEEVKVSEFFEIRDNITPARVRRLGLGALLHTVQDSFAEGHAGRALHEGHHFGPITALRDYGCQSSDKHGAAGRAAHYPWFGAPVHGPKSPVTLGAQLIDLIARNVKWDARAAATAPDAFEPVGADASGAGRLAAEPAVIRPAVAGPPITGRAANTGADSQAAAGAGTGSVAQFIRDAVFPVVAAHAGRVAGAGTGFLRPREAPTAAHASGGILGLLDNALPGAAADCKE